MTPSPLPLFRLALLAPAGLFAVGCRGVEPLPAPVVAAEVALGEQGYRLGCADVVGVRVAGRPECDAVASVGVDGRLPLNLPGAGPVVEGATLGEVRQALATLAGVPAEGVEVTLAAPRAGRVYLTGPENGRQRVVPYIGPEPVVTFLERAGAVRRGCTELHDIRVMRPNVAEGGTPETVRVDVAAIAGGDDAANVLLQASDVVIVGETRRSSFARLLPDWSRPAYGRLVGMCPPDARPMP